MKVFKKQKIKRCPFCGNFPVVEPENPEKDGDTFGIVECVNNSCAARPKVNDDVGQADDRGSDAYKIAAIKCWNKRADSDFLSQKDNMKDFKDFKVVTTKGAYQFKGNSSMLTITKLFFKRLMVISYMSPGRIW